LLQYWHKGCFSCEVCKMTLNMKNYKGFDKKPYCSQGMRHFIYSRNGCRARGHSQDGGHQVTSPLIAQSHVTSPLIAQSHVTSPLITQSHVTSPLIAQSHVTSPLIAQSHVTSRLR
ncbi:LIM zinc-binding domain-containing Nebulette, partial [Anabarilius grahami]